MLLNLMAALSLASIGAVVGIASNSHLVDDVELDKSSLIVRKNAFAYVDGKLLNYFALPTMPGGASNPLALLDVTLQKGSAFGYDVPDEWYESSNGFYYEVVESTNLYVYLILDKNVDTYELLFNDRVLELNEHIEGVGSLAGYYCATFVGVLPEGYSFPEFYHIVLTNDSDTYWENHQIVSGIASGLTSVQHYAASLVSGFDALALDNGALTNSMAFAFTLLGIGTAVGICKLTFNWITGRHGM